MTFGVTLRDNMGADDVQRTSALVCTRAKEVGQECPAGLEAGITNHLSTAISEATGMNAGAIAFQQIQRAWKLLSVMGATKEDLNEVKLQFMHAWSAFPSSGLIHREMTAGLLWASVATFIPTVVMRDGKWKYDKLRGGNIIKRDQEFWEALEICGAMRTQILTSPFAEAESAMLAAGVLPSEFALRLKMAYSEVDSDSEIPVH